MAVSIEEAEPGAQASPAKRAEKIRLAAALRENLKRRKAQLRSRRTKEPPQGAQD